MTRTTLFIGVIALLLLTACDREGLPPTLPPTLSEPQTPVPRLAPPDEWPWHRPLPAVTPAERAAARGTWLYLTAFQNGYVGVVDPASGHALHQIQVDADQAGMAVPTDGGRLYVVDGRYVADGRVVGEGRLRVFDTSTWEIIHREPVPEWARLLGGNPITLSPDGRWLVVEFSNHAGWETWWRIFDTNKLEFAQEDAWKLSDCNYGALRLVGRPGSNRAFAQCHDFVVALNAEDLSVLWRAPSPDTRRSDRYGWREVGRPDLAVSPDDKRLYGMYPHIEHGRPQEGSVPVVGSDLRLIVWETEQGRVVQEVMMSDQVSVPLATGGRGDAGYLAVSRDGAHIFVVWEDILWRLDTHSFKVVGKLRLPAPVDSIAQSVDGRDLYLLPATSGNLKVRQTGMFTVDAITLELIRYADDWPPLQWPFFFAAPAPGSR